MTDFSLNDLLEVLDARPLQGDGMSVTEILRAKGLADTAYQRRKLLCHIREAVERGEIAVGIAWRSRIDGLQTVMPVYRRVKVEAA